MYLDDEILACGMVLTLFLQLIQSKIGISDQLCVGSNNLCSIGYRNIGTCISSVKATISTLLTYIVSHIARLFAQSILPLHCKHMSL